MEINECSNCSMRGYEYADSERKLCHLCVRKEEKDKIMADELIGIFDNFMENDYQKPWPGIEFGKAAIGNSIIKAIQQYAQKWKPSIK